MRRPDRSGEMPPASRSSSGKADGTDSGNSRRPRPALRALSGQALRRTARGLSSLADAASGTVSAPAPAKTARTKPARREAGRPGARTPHPTAAGNGALFDELEWSGDLARAATTATRRLMSAKEGRTARTFAQVLQSDPGTRETGDLCMIVVAYRNRMWQLAWELCCRVGTARAVLLTPVEYFAAGLRLDADAALQTLRSTLSGELPTVADAQAWLRIAQFVFAHGAETESRAALERAQAALAEVDTPAKRKAIRSDIDWLLRWYGRSDAAAADSAPASAEIPIGVLGFDNPDRDETSTDLGDYFESLAGLLQLVRRTGVSFTGDDKLTKFAEQLSRRVRPAARVDGAPATVRLCRVDRDAARCADAPPGTWLLVTGTIPKPTFDLRLDFPYPAHIRPIFVSVHLESPEQLTDDVIAYLREHAPIGCRDWHTTFVLLAAGIPAYFAGGLVSTVGVVAGDGAAPDAPKRLLVDATGEAGRKASQLDDALRDRPLVANLRTALHRIDEYRQSRNIVTSQLQTYLAARAVGTRVKFVPENRSDGALHGLFGMSDESFAASREHLLDRVAAIYDAILAGDDENTVYARWRELCGPDVERASAELHSVAPLPPPPFDIAETCARVREQAVTMERTAAAPAGEEVNVEFSLDGNYKHQLCVVLESVVTHASRPIRAFVLCRDHTQADYDRMARIFPTVSFVFLPMDAVSYGTRGGLLAHTTVATMDRLLTCELLPDVDRIIHHDLDALDLVDLAELYDVDLEGTPIAGRTSPYPGNVSGFGAWTRKAQRYPRIPQRGQEFLQRVCAEHTFDVAIFNAGIMLLDLSVMRKDEFCRRFLPWVARYGMNDQAVLNVYAGRRRVETAPGWNWRPWMEPLPEPKIAHWTGDYKPWSPRWVVGKEIWQDMERSVAAREANAASNAAQ